MVPIVAIVNIIGVVIRAVLDRIRPIVSIISIVSTTLRGEAIKKVSLGH